MRVENFLGIPVYLLQDEDVELPENGNFYVVADNGIFLHKDNGLIKGVTKVEGISSYEPYDDDVGISHNYPQIPTDLSVQIKTFFAKAVEQYKSESIVILHYNPDSKHYIFSIPKQFVNAGHVYYDRNGVSSEAPGYVPVGTIHSHCDFGAFHSGTDQGDEETWDGLHITFGHNDRDVFSISASIILDGNRKKIDPESVVGGVAKQKSNDEVDFWYSFDNTVEIDDNEIQSWIDSLVFSSSDYHSLAPTERPF